MSEVELPLEAPLQDIAYRMIKDDIVTCQLAPNERLTEVQLSSRYNMGKAPIRSGLLRLCHEGLVEAKARRGYVVTPVTIQDIQEIFQLRLILEPRAARLAAGHLNEQQLVRLTQTSQTNYSTDNPESVGTFLEANKIFHVSIAQATGNHRMANTIARLLDEMQRLLHLGLMVRPRGTQYQNEHRQLLEALLAGESEKAEQLSYSQIRGGQEMVLERALSDPQISTTQRSYSPKTPRTKSIDNFAQTL